MSSVKSLFANFRLPADDPTGKKTLASMNKNHRKSNLWALKTLQSIVDARRGFTTNTILDVGCGGGQFLADLNIAWPDATLIGIDHSPAAIQATLDTNAHLVASDKLTAYQATADTTLLDDNSVDIVTACETIYFWPDIDAALQEMRRILRPGGIFMVWVDGSNPIMMKPWEKLIGGMHTYTKAELRDVFTRNGFDTLQLAPPHQPPIYSRLATFGTAPAT
ncbi:class I SAM-dependent methyltransferase [uncultured Lawsonella sp.]|nr:class I SAM-dependent methyltransferase [uncultured Lawsonella sp.]